MFSVDENTKALLHFNNKSNLLKDECGNAWTAHGTPLKFYNEDPYVGGSAFFDLDSYINLNSGFNSLIGVDEPFTIECLFSLKKTKNTTISYGLRRYLFQCYNTKYTYSSDSTTRGWFSIYFYPVLASYRYSYNTTTKVYSHLSNACGTQIYPCIDLNGVTNTVDDTNAYEDDKVIYADEDSWHHIAVGRSGNYLYIHLDGFLVYYNSKTHFDWTITNSNKTTTTYVYDFKPGGAFRIGNAGSTPTTNTAFFGYISELRISNTCRYGYGHYGKYSNIYNEYIRQTLLNYNNNIYHRYSYTWIDSDKKTQTGYRNLTYMLDTGSVLKWPISTTSSSINSTKTFIYHRKNLEEQYSGKKYVNTTSIVEENINKTDYTSEDYLIIYPEWTVDSSRSITTDTKFKYYPLLITNKSQKKYYFYPYNMADDGKTSEEIMDSLASFTFTEEDDFINYPSIYSDVDPAVINNSSYRLRTFGYYPLYITNKNQKKYYYYYINQDHAFDTFDEVMENIELFDLGTEAEEEFTSLPSYQVVDTVTVNNTNLPVRAFNCFPLLITNENKKKYYYSFSGQSNDADTFDEVMENIELFDLGTEGEEEFTNLPSSEVVDTVAVNNVNLSVKAFKYYPLSITNENAKKYYHYPLNIDNEANTFDEVMEGIVLFAFSEEEEEFTIVPSSTVVDTVTVDNVAKKTTAFKYYPLLITNENEKKYYYWLFNQDEAFDSFEEVMKYIELFSEFENASEAEKEITILPIEKFKPDNTNEEKYFDTDSLNKEFTGRFYKYYFNLTDRGDDTSTYSAKANFDTLRIPILILHNDTKLVIKDDFPIFMAYKYL